jgi:murein DD-endopeptidase MepM/ murein hydrolase activator NlpD
MALTDIQKQQLQGAYYRTGGQTEEDKRNIKYAQDVFGWQPTVPQATAPVVETETTPAKDYSGLYDTKTAEETAYESELVRQQAESQSLATGAVDEATIRANTERQFQQEIDALNAVYAQKKVELARQGQGRIGESTSIQARRGLIGSDFGSAQTENVRSYNQEILDTAEAERQVKEQAIRGKIRQSVVDEMAAKTSAKEQGATAYLEFLKGAVDRKTQTVSSVVANMISDGEEYDDKSFNVIAGDLKIKPAELKRQYNTAKAEAEAKSKGEEFTLNEGQIRYDSDGNVIAGTAKPTKPEVQSVGGNLLQYNTTTGKWDTIFSAPKDTDKPITQVVDKVLYQYDSTTNSWKPVASAADKTSADSLATLKDKQIAIENLKTSSGKSKAVGAYGLARWTPTKIDKADVQDFIAGVNNLISKDTLDTLINLKQAGGTLGALSDQERIMLQNAASKISSWAKKDEVGNTMYYNISEELFDKELDRLKMLTDRAINNASINIDNNQDDPLGITSSPFNQVGNTSASKTSYLNNYGAITGEDGSPYWKWGLDVDLKKGDPVFSPVSGVVVQAGDKGDGFGNRVGIKTPQGNIVYLSHLDGVDVKVGQSTSTNQMIGKGGNSGKTIAVGGGDGSHLDITVKKPDGTYYTPQEIKSKLS